MYERAQRLFLGQHPDPANTIFLMMKFSGHPELQAIRAALTATASESNFDVVRADDADYTGELWANATLCMENSSIGIAVFDSVSGMNGRDSNVYLELGYMLALSRPCLLLRDHRLGPPAAMVAHRLHNYFDSYDIAGTLGPPVNQWLQAHRGMTSGDAIRPFPSMPEG